MSQSALLKSGFVAGLTSLGFFTASPPASAQTLTGLAQFSADSSGNASGGHLWTTHPSFGGHKLFVVRDANPTANFLPGQPGLSAALGNGHHIFFIFGEPGGSTGFSGLNLFFDGGAAPGISVKGIDRTGTGASMPFSANGGSTLDLLGGSVAGTNSLTTTAGGKQIVLSKFEWSTPNANFYNEGRNFNRVNAGAHEDPALPDGEETLGENDFVGKFELDVTDAPTDTVPEPGSLLLFLPGLAALAVIRRR